MNEALGFLRMTVRTIPMLQQVGVYRQPCPQQVKRETQGPRGHCCTMHNAPGGRSFDETDAQREAKVWSDMRDRSARRGDRQREAEKERDREKVDVVFVFLISPATTCVVRAVNGCQRQWGLDQWQGGSQSARVLQSVHMSVSRVALTRSGCVFVLCPCTVLDVFSNVDTGACERYAVPIWWANRHATRRISMWELVGLTLG